MVDYQSALNIVLAAQDSFDLLPANIRLEFNHDPELFLKAVDDPNQRARLVDLGVLVDSEAPGEVLSSEPIPKSGVPSESP